MKSKWQRTANILLMKKKVAAISSHIPRIIVTLQQLEQCIATEIGKLINRTEQNLDPYQHMNRHFLHFSAGTADQWRKMDYSMNNDATLI